MHRSHDRETLEARTIEAQRLYIKALVELERVQDGIDEGSLIVTHGDLIQAECLLAERRFALVDLLSALGYTPKGFTAKLPRRSGKGGHRLDATSDPDIAALRLCYLAWQGNSVSVDTGRSIRSMLNLGRVLILLGALSEEDMAAEEPSGEAIPN
ncbi:transcriptional repressor TraM [Methylobacterium sp. J-043]|uniref:transcriptional repressor TraM n=1 Tax=Methylorubrum TaxID=2282523 RepID=UPI001477B004|nr:MULTISPECIES: transcriptional repressor TraM [Methylorubrum]MCJ2032498.1 transcriptional repressor TraM [Methylobacterium sp. J-043]MDF9861093.1 hypothetical protein [Methylorubrum pseudosasae]MDH6640075.1 hypothetical protein [Methylobacterium sp. SuP10 SLI 274]MCP1551607.1 hypothetical protein [Methylorubrum zatmanii]MCP1556544.1 hypothetical protein [Methylorubrum extorquens]